MIGLVCLPNRINSVKDVTKGYGNVIKGLFSVAALAFLSAYKDKRAKKIHNWY